MSKPECRCQELWDRGHTGVCGACQRKADAALEAEHMKELRKADERYRGLTTPVDEYGRPQHPLDRIADSWSDR